MISSWTAKIIPFVTGASMALVAFFAGQRIIKATKAKSEKLPSPHQVSILIGLLNGGKLSLLLDDGVIQETVLSHQHYAQRLT